MKSFSIFLSLIICFSISVLPQSSENKAAVEFYKKAVEYYGNGETKKAIDALKKSLKLDNSFSDARNKLAEIYMDDEKAINRMKAEKELKKALLDDPENFEYRYNLAKTYLKRGYTYNARKYFEFLTKEYPKNTKVLSSLGDIYILQLEKYKNMFAPGPYGMSPFYDDNLYSYISEYGMEREFTGFDIISGISLDGTIPKFSYSTKEIIENRISSYTLGISFAKWANEDYQNAVSAFNKIVEINPEHRDAHFRLGILAYDNQDLNDFIYHQRKIIENNKNDKDAHLFLGLGLHEMNQPDEAFKEFSLAKNLMEDDEREVFESLEYIFSEEEKNEYELLSELEREKFIKKYWKIKDPLYLTDISERMLEHYSRVAYSNLKFGVPKMDVAGWESDRGKIYIRYGKPDNEIKIRPELEFSGPKGGYNFSIIWYYPNYSFVFSDPYSTGEFSLSKGESGSRFPRISFQEVEKDLQKIYPENYNHDYGGKLFAFNHYTACFKGENGNTHLEVYYAIPQNCMQYNSDRGKFSAEIKKGLFIFDENWEGIERDISIEEFYSEDFPDSTKLFHIVKQNNLEIQPGNYMFAIEIQDQSSKNIGIKRETISVESFKSDSLQLSDVILAVKVDSISKESEFTSRGFEIIPNPSKHYLLNDPLYLYYEIYNLKLGTPGVTDYTVEYKINKYKNKRSTFIRLFAGIGRLFGIGGRKEEISTSYKYSGINQTEKQHLTINMKTKEPGLYELSLAVTDMNSGQKVTKKRTVFITNYVVNYLY